MALQTILIKINQWTRMDNFHKFKVDFAISEFDLYIWGILTLLLFFCTRVCALGIFFSFAFFQGKYIKHLITLM